MSEIICIYHDNCADGFTAAWVVYQALGPRVKFVPAKYSDAPPVCDGDAVLIVDFSYPRAMIDAIARVADSVLILDHHKTAKEELAGLPRSPGDGNIEVIFDMDRSGAQIAWDRLFGGPRPPLVDYVGDRDLSTWNLPDSRPINAVIQSWARTFDAWTELEHRLADDVSQGFVAAEGMAVLRAEQKMVDDIIAATARPMKIAGRTLKVANCPFGLSSVVAGTLAEDQDFGACYADTPDGRAFSLRSRGDDAADVSAIAKSYGGGGHRNAAGFLAKRGWEGDE